MNNPNIIDLSGAVLDWSDYSGSEKKYSLVLDGVKYMVKLPDPVREIKNDLSYMNNQFSEFVGCRIFESVGIPVQKTYLGQYNHDGKDVIVVACRDFINDGIRLYPMKYIHSKDLFGSSNNKGKLTISKVYDLINGLKDPTLESKTINHFWKMFVIDYLIGNYDRHLENWGMAKTSDGQRIPAPVYDCGSSLLPLSSDETLQKGIKKKSFGGDSLAVLTPFSDEVQGRRLFFKDIIEAAPKDLETAIKDVFPKISLPEIYRIINETPFMSDIRKSAMIESVKARYNQVLLKAYVRIAYPNISDYDQKRIISSTKSRNNSEMRKLGYKPLSTEKGISR